MSVVVVVKDKGRVVVGCDERMSSWADSYTDSYEDRPKGIIVQNQAIVAGTGNVALVDLFGNEIVGLEEFSRESILYNVVIPLMSKLHNTCYLDKDCNFDGEIVIAKDSKAFRVAGNGTISEVNSFLAIGSGSLSALGSLTTTFWSNISAEEKVAKAIESAGSVISTVSTTGWIADTKSLQFRKTSKFNRKW